MFQGLLIANCNHGKPESVGRTIGSHHLDHRGYQYFGHSLDQCLDIELVMSIVPAGTTRIRSGAFDDGRDQHIRRHCLRLDGDGQ